MPDKNNLKKKLQRISPAFLVLVSIIIISAAMHARHFQKDLMSMHVWRQCETQSTILNFYDEDMNILNPRRNDRGNSPGYHRMEFPLTQWLVACTYKIFGNHLVISRIFMFIIGLFSVFGFYKLLKTLFNHEFLALAGAWAFNFSPCFYYYTICPMPDNLALCCGIWGIAIFFSWIKTGRSYALPLSGLLLSISALCKLPFILYFVVPLTYFLVQVLEQKSWKVPLVKCAQVLIFTVLPLAWYVSVVSQWQGNGIVRGILDNKAPASVFLDNLWFNLTISLPDLLLNYGSVLFFLCGFYFIRKNRAYKNRQFPLFAALGTALLLYCLFELNMIGKVHDYYFFPLMPLLFILVAYGAYHLFNLKLKLIRYFVIIVLLALPFLAYLRMAHRWDPSSPGFNKDLLVYKNELREAVPKDALCIAGNDISHYIFFYYIDKKGWGFDDNNLSGENLHKMIEDGAEYLYSDSRQIDDNLRIAPFLDKLIMEKGSVRVYSLKEVPNF